MPKAIFRDNHGLRKLSPTSELLRTRSAAERMFYHIERNARQTGEGSFKVILCSPIYLEPDGSPIQASHGAQDCFGAFISHTSEHYQLRWDNDKQWWVLDNQTINYETRFKKLSDALVTITEYTGVSITADLFTSDIGVGFIGVAPPDEQKSDPERPQTFGAWS